MEDPDASVVFVEDSKLFIIDEFGTRTETNNDGSLSSITSDGTDENNATTLRFVQSPRKHIRRKKRKTLQGPSAISTPLPLNVVASNSSTPRGVKRRSGRPKKSPPRKKSISTVMISSDESSSSDDSVVLVPRNNSVIIELSDDEDVGVCAGSVETESSNNNVRRVASLNQHDFKIFKNDSTEVATKTKPLLGGMTTARRAKKTDPSKLRPVVVDGCNVAFGHGLGLRFSAKGLQICVDYFEKRGHKVVVFVPQFRRRHPATTDQHVLDDLEKKGTLAFTPSRKVQGKMIASYDDRYIVEYAHMCGGVVVSRDNYRDLLAENPSWQETIEKRLLMFTWVGDVIMFPSDPLGRGGPSLDDILKF